MRFLILSLIVIFSSFFADLVSAQMSSANFEIRWDTIGAGGSDDSTSASYQLRDTIGNTGIGNSSSANYDARAGYRQGIFDQVISFDLFTQSNSNTEATALVGNTVTVAGTTGFSTGNMVAVIQDLGSSQVAGIGEITGIAGNNITLDNIETGGPALVIDGTNDYLYRMSGSSVGFGTVDDTDYSTALVGWEVTVDTDDGYTVYVLEDGNLRDGANDIDDVVDGAVTLGSEEYGARSSDQTLAGSTFDTADTAFTGSFQEVGTKGSLSYKSRDFLTLKATVAAGTPEGDYSHTISLISSGNF